MVIDHQIRAILVGPAGEEAVEAVEAFLQRPVGAVAARRHVLTRNEMPLASGKGAVAGPAEDLRDVRRRGGDAPARVGVALVAAGQLLHADRVRVAARQQRSARRRADGF